MLNHLVRRENEHSKPRETGQKLSPCSASFLLAGHLYAKTGISYAQSAIAVFSTVSSSTPPCSLSRCKPGLSGLVGSGVALLTTTDPSWEIVLNSALKNLHASRKLVYKDSFNPAWASFLLAQRYF